MPKIKPFLDEYLHLALGLALRKRGYDALHAQELQRKGRTDAEQLAYASSQQCCLFTFNVKDFVLLHAKYAGDGDMEHWGIVVSRQLPVGEMLRRMLRLLQAVHCRGDEKSAGVPLDRDGITEDKCASIHKPG